MPYKDKNKQREYARIWTNKRRSDFFENKKCEKCNSTENLELHHIDKKEKEEHRIWSWSEERRDKEISKCVIWCRKCHEDFHAEEKKKPIKHGSLSGYKHYNCRCEECKKANSNYELNRKRACSSIGRASDLQSEGSRIVTDQVQ